nr:MAG TPA: hypothetical protein [Caudoviricetes sp.]DAX18868.1 MAG TPA: hypothetical protein [Caudoviricetes sp.]
MTQTEKLINEIKEMLFLCNLVDLKCIHSMLRGITKDKRK